jgi:hypothetical protein
MRTVISSLICLILFAPFLAQAETVNIGDAKSLLYAVHSDLSILFRSEKRKLSSFLAVSCIKNLVVSLKDLSMPRITLPT